MDLISLSCPGTIPVLWLSKSLDRYHVKFGSGAKCPGRFQVVTIIKF